jgi:nicotinamidase-related amidase
MNKTALVVIDLQNEYLPTGKLPLSGLDAAVANAVAAIGHARATGIPVFHVQHVATDPASPIFAPHTPNVDIQPAVAPRDGEPGIVKHPGNAFRATDFKEKLDAAGVEALVIAGAMSHMCVEACARAAADLDYAVTVLHDACATLDLEFGGVTTPAGQVHAAAMASLEFGYATVRSTRDWLAGG